jgi:hypothetical protein|tara:strand:- start:1768 stop:2067 length:300 start_codon:yes stop_codon:yes gene_type:complete
LLRGEQHVPGIGNVVVVVVVRGDAAASVVVAVVVPLPVVIVPVLTAPPVARNDSVLAEIDQVGTPQPVPYEKCNRVFGQVPRGVFSGETRDGVWKTALR